jgi:hypothetical protein
MTEFISGVAIGICIAVLARGNQRGRGELEADNRALRDGLRYTRNVMVNTGTMVSVARYIDRLLADEAGA